jgi:dTDP-4-amino-4,6-dideoxygalactose transaminase
VYYPRLVFDYDAYRDRDDVVIEPTPVAERVSRETVSLPVHTRLSQDELDQIIAAVRRVLGADAVGADA